MPHVPQRDLFAVWQALDRAGLATPNIGLASDIHSCPGLDYCSLANARSIPLAQELSLRFREFERMHDLGQFHINISGCINACGHHHVGHVGLLGVEKNGEEFYQVTVGGRADEKAVLGELLGRAVPRDQIADVVEEIAHVYLKLRQTGELFPDTVARVGIEAVKAQIHASH